MSSDFTLYALTAAQQQFVECGMMFDRETGEVFFEEPHAFELALSEKAEACAVRKKSIAAQVDALKAERAVLDERIKAGENAMKRFDEYLLACVENNGAAIETPKCRIGTRKSSSVEIIDESKIPPTYIRKKVTESIDKAAIKKAIKDGGEVPGAYVVEKKNISIK